MSEVEELTLKIADLEKALRNKTLLADTYYKWIVRWDEMQTEDVEDIKSELWNARNLWDPDTWEPINLEE